MRNLLAITIIMTILVSCGLGKERPRNTELAREKQLYQYLEGNCGSKVVSDYERVLEECYYETDEVNYDNCEYELIRFKSKYPRIACITETFDGPKDSFTILEQDIGSWLEAIQTLDID